MEQSSLTVAQQVGHAASAFEQRLTGRAPRSVTVVLGQDTLVITLHGVLSPAEQVLAQSPAGAVQVQALHQQLFTNSLNWLKEEINRITGVRVRSARAEAITRSGSVVRVVTTGTVVQVFLLASEVPIDTWSGSGPAPQA